MKWTVDVRQVRAHEGAADLPVVHEATISIDAASTPEEPVALSDFRDLLTKAVNQLNVPATAEVTGPVRLSLRW